MNLAAVVVWSASVDPKANGPLFSRSEDTGNEVAMHTDQAKAGEVRIYSSITYDSRQEKTQTWNA